ncbi:hypothetical protein BDR03DRAFT_981127 [Suillus americanus]|nr:hypothetical protein BDR03DRAFT_981127 [Suillus americanus]
MMECGRPREQYETIKKESIQQMHNDPEHPGSLASGLKASPQDELAIQKRSHEDARLFLLLARHRRRRKASKQQQVVVTVTMMLCPGWLRWVAAWDEYWDIKMS